MAIDKIIPQYLNKDVDERLSQNGDMIDALNVTLSPGRLGRGEGIIKNIKGTNAISSASDNDVLNSSFSYTAIGSVTDETSGDIYWFLFCDDTPSDHRILKYSDSSGTYSTVLRGSWLNFSKSFYITANVLRTYLPETDYESVILYFTDNRNEPRKINVSTVGQDYYQSLTDAEKDFAFNTIKAAQTTPLSVFFNTDTSYPRNNFIQNPLQYAIQYIYNDGEESALSTYSKLSVNPRDLIDGLSTGSFNVRKNAFNICNIRLNLIDDISDLKRVRIVARRGNSGNFFLVDEFNPYEDKNAVLNTGEYLLYDSSTRTYRFRNDVVGELADPGIQNKMYDNVPLKARGQSVSANRLIYSNYTEGRDNFDINEYTRNYSSFTPPSIRVSYGLEEGQDLNLYNGHTPVLSLAQGDTRVYMNFDNLVDVTTIPVNTFTDFSFDFEITGNLENTTQAPDKTPFITPLVRKQSGNNITFISSSIESLNLQDQISAVTISEFFVSNQELSLEGYVSELAQQISEQTYIFEYLVGGTDGIEVVLEDGNVGIVYGKVKLEIKFDYDISSTNPETLLLLPVVTGVRLNEAFIADSENYISYSFADPGLASPASDSDDWDEQGWGTGMVSTSNVDLSIIRSGKIGSFKAGSHHKLGVVYYDKYNRSGFVNELGSFYVKWPGERNQYEGFGAASVTVDLHPGQGNNLQAAPSWAEGYQIVYTGSTDIDSYVQYRAFNGYFRRFRNEDELPSDQDSNNNVYIPTYPNVIEEAHVGDPDFTKCQIYVNIDSLDIYNADKDSLRNYSFTKGDKLRIVSFERTTQDPSDTQGYVTTTEYPVANDGSIMEFDIVGVEVIDATAGADNPLHDTTHTDGNHYHEQYTGTFLVLEQPEISAGAEFIDSNGDFQPLAYPGFDFFSVAYNAAFFTRFVAYKYRSQSATSANNTPALITNGQRNYWGNNVVVELYTPKQRSSSDIYYEIGERQPLNITSSLADGTPMATYGPGIVALDSGDTHWRPVATLTKPGWPNDNFTAKNKKAFYLDKYLESSTVSDFYDSEFWDRGRPNAVLPSASEKTISNSLTYSDAYEQNSGVFKLSSFDPSLGNYVELDLKYGAINYIGSYNDDLVCLQERKLSLVPINKNIIEYAQGSSNVAISTNVFGNARYSSGEYGCGPNPEAVLSVDNDIYFVDANKEAVLRFSGGQVSVISDVGIKTFFRDNIFASGNNRFFSGFDLDENAYYITSKGSSTNTVGYSISANKWQSRYSFAPDYYATSRGDMYSFYGGLWKHNNENERCLIYGDEQQFFVEVISKIQPSRVKVFNALSYEGDVISTNTDEEGFWTVPSGGITTDLGTTTGSVTEFKKKEGSMFAVMPRRNVTGYYESHNLTLGALDFISGNLSSAVYYSDRNVARLPIPVGTPIPQFTVPGSGFYYNVVIKSVNGKKIVFDFSNASTSSPSGVNPDSFEQSLSGGGPLPTIMNFDNSVNGDAIRGHWASVKLRGNTSTETQLYCINLHVSDSKLQHALDQQ